MVHWDGRGTMAQMAVQDQLRKAPADQVQMVDLVSAELMENVAKMARMPVMSFCHCQVTPSSCKCQKHANL